MSPNPVHNTHSFRNVTKVLKWLLDQKVQQPPAFFIEEMYAYINLKQGNNAVAKEYYKNAAAMATRESGNYKRSITTLEKYP